jgi:hypothetical protein
MEGVITLSTVLMASTYLACSVSSYSIANVPTSTLLVC